MQLTAFALYALLSSAIPASADIDAAIHKAMADTGAKGLAIAVIDNGQVAYAQAYGIRNTNNDPLTPDTIMYGASLTKTVMAYTALQLVDQGKLNLDAPI
ncbi:serine hydrolase domain-containing protein, partial [Asticcacaulis biprosthecium]